MSEAKSDRIIWQGFPSWGHFSWLYFFIFIMAVRGLLFLRFGHPGWPIWISGACLLFLVIVLIRRWAYYVVTPTRVIIKNGYTQHEISSIKLEMIGNIELIQGPISKFWEIGTLVIQSSHEGQWLQLRGVKHPDVVKTKVRALISGPLEHHSFST